MTTPDRKRPTRVGQLSDLTEQDRQGIYAAGEGGVYGAMAATAIAEMAGYRQWVEATPPEERPPGNLI